MFCGLHGIISHVHIICCHTDQPGQHCHIDLPRYHRTDPSSCYHTSPSQYYHTRKTATCNPENQFQLHLRPDVSFPENFVADDRETSCRNHRNMLRGSSDTRWGTQKNVATLQTRWSVARCFWVLSDTLRAPPNTLRVNSRPATGNPDSLRVPSKQAAGSPNTRPGYQNKGEKLQNSPE